MWTRKEYILLIVSSIVTVALSANSPATNSNGSNRQAAGTGIISAITSMIPGALGNIMPMVLLFGLGALMVPALGLGLLLREGRRSEPYLYHYRSFPSFKINTSALVDGASDVLDRVMKALDNVDKKYN